MEIEIISVEQPAAKKTWETPVFTEGSIASLTLFSLGTIFDGSISS